MPAYLRGEPGMSTTIIEFKRTIHPLRRRVIQHLRENTFHHFRRLLRAAIYQRNAAKMHAQNYRLLCQSQQPHLSIFITHAEDAIRR